MILKYKNKIYMYEEQNKRIITENYDNLINKL